MAVNPSGGVIQKRHTIATELQSISALVEEMLTMAKQSYNAALTASHMGQFALEHTLTITELRRRIADLQNEISSWVMRSSKDSTAAMILAEENVVLAKVNFDLYARMQELQERHRKQTEILSGLLTNIDFGLPSTVLPEALPSGQALLDLRFAGSLLQAHRRNKGTSREQQRTAERSSSSHRCDARRIGRVDRATIKSSVRARPQRRQRISECLSKATRQSTVAHSTDKHKLGTVGKG